MPATQILESYISKHWEHLCCSKKSFFQANVKERTQIIDCLRTSVQDEPPKSTECDNSFGSILGTVMHYS